MLLSIQSPKKALNKAYLKEKVGRGEIESFKKHFKALLARINEGESEENNKNIVADFLKDTWYREQYEINTKGRTDLVIHTGKTSADPVGVILEVKKPSNRTEMISVAKPNTKALQELVLYYLRERIDGGAKFIRHLIITNIWEWYLIDEVWFEQHVYGNAPLRKDYEAYKQSGKTTQFFYDNIAKPFLEKIQAELPCTYFDIRSYEGAVKNERGADDHKLIALYKILSPVHLLKEKFANDSNSLDKRFYEELLHIIGLEEVKDGGRKLIKRKAKPDEASLLENALAHIDERDSLYQVDNYSSFGSNRTEQQLGIALELCITWVNRVLFMKLLEAQLSRYHKKDQDYLFLNTSKIHDYDELSNLFFGVLAEKPNNRKPRLKDKFHLVPYLNSSLFERTTLERQALEISALDNQLQLPIAANTVLKDDKGKKRTGALTTLDYLFRFLDAYDFTSEGSEEIQEENKNLINASVLGLIFEKINGYKDGSFFTPGFVTMYMCRETIRRAVYQKFREAKGWEVESIDALHDLIRDKQEANALINSLTICDPAVGSGHFLVSALNELIAIKSELKILLDSTGRTLRDYEVQVVNDELIVTDDDGQLYEYNPHSAESRRVQQALFHEKETLIEHCLFGVDINPNSVKICRLRLWIELLKNAYYTAESSYTELETLPNIDINIKTGNSLVSRFALDADLGKALKSLKWDIATYRGFVHDYKNATGKEEKRGLEQLIEGIKKDFRTEIGLNDKKLKQLAKLSSEHYDKYEANKLFAQKLTADQKKHKDKLEKEIANLNRQIEEVKSNSIYENAFEWRFEFPEVLDDDGAFLGFDVVIGNPPYIRQEQLGNIKNHFADHYNVFAGTADILVYFFERGLDILKRQGHLSFITSNKFTKSNYGSPLRGYLARQRVLAIIDFGELPVFEEAATFPAIYELLKDKPGQQFNFNQIQDLTFDSLYEPLMSSSIAIESSMLQDSTWNFTNSEVSKLLMKLRANFSPLIGEVPTLYRGLITGFNEAFVIDEAKRRELIFADSTNEELIKPFALGDDVRRFHIRDKKRYLILTPIGVDIQKYPAIFEHLQRYEEQLKARYDKGKHWWELRACDYYGEFAKAKIVYPDIAKESRFAFSEAEQFFGNTCYFFPTNDLSLLAILNSKLLWFWYKNSFSVLGDANKGGRLRFFTQDFSKVPIAPRTSEQTAQFTKLVNQINSIVESNDVIKILEEEINRLVYELYELSEAEIKIIESK